MRAFLPLLFVFALFAGCSKSKPPQTRSACPTCKESIEKGEACAKCGKCSACDTCSVPEAPKQKDS